MFGRVPQISAMDYRALVDYFAWHRESLVAAATLLENGRGRDAVSLLKEVSSGFEDFITGQKGRHGAIAERFLLELQRIQQSLRTGESSKVRDQAAQLALAIASMQSDRRLVAA